MSLAVISSAALLAGAGLSLRFTWWRPRRPGAPILMYHQVGPHRKGSRLNKWRVTEADFERQLAHLDACGLRGVSLREHLANPSGRHAVLTFDDGFLGVATHALPHLVARGFTATVFVVSGKLGGTNDWDRDESPADPLLSEGGVRELHAAGIEIGSHGETHRALTEVDDAELFRQTAGSRERLEDVIGAPVATFCYPYGAFDDRVVEAVRAAGYRAATVIRGGISPDLSDPYRLKRVAVRGTNTLLDFRLALTRGRSRL